MTIGSELQEVDFGGLILSVAQGIADGQRALDMTSLNTLQILANTTVSLIPEVTETITPAPFEVNVPNHPPVMVTGVRVSGSASEPVPMSALQAGLIPTFYQFTEATINMRVSIQLRQTTETDSSGNTQSSIGAFGSHVNFRSKNTYSFSLNAASTVNVTMKPLPPPTRLQPSVITVNALGAAPTVTFNP